MFKLPGNRSYLKEALILMALILFYPALSGQQTTSRQDIAYPAEEIRVHLSQTCLFPGEVMAFKIYCTNPLFPALEISRMAFIEVVSDRNTSMLRKKILLENGTGGGEFIMPVDMNSGIYTVLTYTNWLKNFGEDCFDRQNIVILNPDHVIVPDTCQQQPDGPSRQSTPHSDPRTGIILATDKETYGTREKVTLKIIAGQGEGEQAGGRFSVSVYRTEPSFCRSTSEASTRRSEIGTEEIAYLPDFRGIRLTGSLRDRAGYAMGGARIILSEPGPGTKIRTAMSDDLGNFHFLLPPREGEMDIVFTLPDEKTTVQLEEPFWNGFRNPPPPIHPCLNSKLLSFMEEKYYHYQLAQRFNLSVFSVHEPVTGNPKDDGRFYTHHYRLIDMDDYIMLDSLSEYFYELMPSVRFIQNRGDYDIRVLDPLTKRNHKENPGVFVDGVIYSDYREMARIPVGEIEDIAILNEVYYYRDFCFGGIIDLHTKNADFNAVRLLPNMNRLIYPLASMHEMKFGQQDHSPSGITDRMPDFRYLICWEPDIMIGDSGVTTIHFFTGDVSGEFTIKLSGISPEGMIGEAQRRIMVGPDPGTGR